MTPSEADESDTPWCERLLTLPGRDAGDPVLTTVRAVVLAVSAVWGAYLATRDIADGAAWPSFMHGILLVIHEAGHILFMPFGELLMMAGGSVFQVALPFAIGAAFLQKNRDPFGAAVCLWWTGMSLIDLAPYIYDALDPQLMMLGGRTGEDGPHDWIWLFERLGGLPHAQTWARAVHAAGALLAIIAIGWGAAVLWRARREYSR